jgi:hypothetical protein
MDIPISAFLPPTLDEYINDYVGVKRLRDITITGVFLDCELKALEDHIEKGDPIWFQIPNTPWEVRCIVIEVKSEEGHVRECTARPTGRPRRIRKTPR